jgi:hypothetical protein
MNGVSVMESNHKISTKIVLSLFIDIQNLIRALAICYMDLIYIQRHCKYLQYFLYRQSIIIIGSLNNKIIFIISKSIPL